jgi:DNA-directed RNA polymerase subunit RPC12/RpoP
MLDNVYYCCDCESYCVEPDKESEEQDPRCPYCGGDLTYKVYWEESFYDTLEEKRL